MDDQVRTDATATKASIGDAQAALRPLAQIEKFTAIELTNLRNELWRGGLDSWQAADVAGNFLAGHGYGASADQLRALIASIEVSRCSIDCLQTALEGVAYIQ